MTCRNHMCLPLFVCWIYRVHNLSKYLRSRTTTFSPTRYSFPIITCLISVCVSIRLPLVREFVVSVFLSGEILIGFHFFLKFPQAIPHYFPPSFLRVCLRIRLDSVTNISVYTQTNAMLRLRHVTIQCPPNVLRLLFMPHKTLDLQLLELVNRGMCLHGHTI